VCSLSVFLLPPPPQTKPKQTTQSTIIHTSLLRVLTPDQLTPDTTASIAAACERWTQRLAGRRLVVPAAWWVSEAEFSTIQGERVPLRFGC
jgi:hypothetical protein